MTVKAVWQKLKLLRLRHEPMLLNMFLHLNLNEILLLLSFFAHFFYLVPCIWEF